MDVENHILDELEEKAKEQVIKWYGPGIERKWLIASPENSYENRSYMCRLSVLEGSPPKGYVLRTARYVIAVDNIGKRKKTWTPTNLPIF